MDFVFRWTACATCFIACIVSPIIAYQGAFSVVESGGPNDNSAYELYAKVCNTKEKTPPPPQYPDYSPYNSNNYADPVYPFDPNYPDYTSDGNYQAPPPEYETVNCTDVFPQSGQCIKCDDGDTFNFLYWSLPTGACYIYTSDNCTGNGDGGVNDYTSITGQAPSFSSVPPNNYTSFKCFAKYLSNPSSLYPYY